MNRRKSITFAFGLACATACGSAPADVEPGRETGACVANECLGELVCLSELCVDPNATPTTDGTGAGSNGGSGVVDDSGGNVPVNSVSVLVVVDNSGSMGEEQSPLAQGIGTLAQALTTAGIDWRIGMTTTDVGNPWCQGTGPEAGNLRLTSCRSRPAEFMFQGAQVIDAFNEACGDICPPAWETISIEPTTVEGGGAPTPRPWVESIGGATNLPAELTIEDAFNCVVPQGINGCGFEGQLDAMWRALARAPLDSEPSFGFVPSDALLVVVIATDEADCSTNPAFESIFLPEGNRVFWSDDTAAAPTSAVCWNAGVQCSGGDCMSANYDELGNQVPDQNAADQAVLYPLARYSAKLSEFGSPLFTLIGGYQSDGSVLYQDSLDDPGFQADFGIGPGCESTSGRAVPPVRMRELAEQLMVGDAPHAASICGNDHTDTMNQLAAAIVARVQ